MITVTVYKNRDNTVDLEMRADGQAQNITGTTRMVLTIGDTVIDSQLYAGSFDWNTNGANGQLSLTLGLLANLIKMRAATYLSSLVFYDATYTSGLRWGNGFQTKIVE